MNNYKNFNELSNEHGISKAERLSFIDYKIRFFGSIFRKDLTQRFGIKEAASSGEINLYKKIVPDNIEHDRVSRINVIKEDTYCPLIETTPSDLFNLLLSDNGLINGGDDSKLNANLYKCPKLFTPDTSTIAFIHRAIHQGKAIGIEYVSTSSGRTTREIVPIALADGGLRWHLRAYCRKQCRFIDFILTRIINVFHIENSEPAPNETKVSDDEWNIFIPLVITPHPEQPHPEAIALDSNMKNNELRVNIRGALAGYFLRHLNIDCTSKGTLKGNQYQLWLKNSTTLIGLSNNRRGFFLAPGSSDHN